MRWCIKRLHIIYYYNNTTDDDDDRWVHTVHRLADSIEIAINFTFNIHCRRGAYWFGRFYLIKTKTRPTRWWQFLSVSSRVLCKSNICETAEDKVLLRQRYPAADPSLFLNVISLILFFSMFVSLHCEKRLDNARTTIILSL